MGDWLRPSRRRAGRSRARRTLAGRPPLHVLHARGAARRSRSPASSPAATTGRRGSCRPSTATTATSASPWRWTRTLLAVVPPLVPGITKVPFGDVAAVERAVGDDTAAVCMETIPATAGYIVPPDDYLAERPRDLRRARRAADPRRGPSGPGADRADLGVRALGGGAGPAGRRQGPVRRRVPHRRARSASGSTPSSPATPSSTRRATAGPSSAPRSSRPWSTRSPSRGSSTTSRRWGATGRRVRPPVRRPSRPARRPPGAGPDAGARHGVVRGLLPAHARGDRRWRPGRVGEQQAGHAARHAAPRRRGRRGRRDHRPPRRGRHPGGRPVIEPGELRALEDEVTAALASQDTDRLPLLGHGEISLVLGWPPGDAPGWRASGSRPSGRRRVRALRDGRGPLHRRAAGRRRPVVETDLHHLVRPDGGWWASTSSRRCRAVRSGRRSSATVTRSVGHPSWRPSPTRWSGTAPRLGVDAQLSNWAWLDGEPWQLDLTTPFLLDERGGPEFDLTPSWPCSPRRSGRWSGARWCS